MTKYDSAGTLQWTKQLGTNSDDYSSGVSVDGSGNVYISGRTYGDLGGVNAGGPDAFLSKYDALGTHQWTKQLGTASADTGNSVSADGLGNVYISGETRGSLGGANAGFEDAFVAKYDSGGTLQWTKQLGTNSDDHSNGVSADGLGNVYISGFTYGDLSGVNAGSTDAFVNKYDDAGTLHWTRQLGTVSDDRSYSVSADGLGNVYITGETYGSLGGPKAGDWDAFVSKYDDAGTLLWTRQLGGVNHNVSHDVSADGLGNIYISGTTEDSMGGPPISPGTVDAFVAKIADPIVPEASTLALVAIGIFGLAACGKRRR